MSTIRLKSKYQKFSFEGKEGGYVTRAHSYANIRGGALLDAALQNSGLDRGTFFQAINAILKEFNNFVLNGHPTHFPGLGSFRFSCNAKSAETEKEGGADCVYRRRIIFTPGSELKQLMKAVRLESMAPIDDDPITPVDPGNG